MGGRVSVLLAAAGLSAACVPERLERCGPGAPGDARACVVPGWTDRAFDLQIPSSWDGVTPVPLVVMLHGGAGNRAGTDRTTCPDGDAASPSCFAAQALARGWVVAIPDGTGSRPLRGVRTWNAGGGGASPLGELDCTSGPACREGVDDLAYIRALLAEVERAVPIDARRIYATGLSNGGAMSHRLACEAGDRFAAVVSVAGGNQHALAGGACPGGAAVMEVHGTADVCWPYAGGVGDCFAGGYKAGVDDMMAAWAARNGCTVTTITEVLPDADPADAVTSTRRTWGGCARATALVRMEGAGHTWPGGHPYLELAGRVTRDFDSAVLLEFMDANPRP